MEVRWKQSTHFCLLKSRFGVKKATDSQPFVDLKWILKGSKEWFFLFDFKKHGVDNTFPQKKMAERLWFTWKWRRVLEGAASKITSCSILSKIHPCNTWKTPKWGLVEAFSRPKSSCCHLWKTETTLQGSFKNLGPWEKECHRFNPVRLKEKGSESQFRGPKDSVHELNWKIIWIPTSEPSLDLDWLIGGWAPRYHK